MFIKIVVKERGSKSYYDEFLYVYSKFKTLLKNPNKKIHKLTTCLSVYSCIVFLFIVLLVIFYICFKDILFVYLIGMMSLILLITLAYIFGVLKKIKMYMSIVGDKTIDINEKSIEFIDEDRQYTLKWNDVSHVLINKHTICFLPKELNGIIIALPSLYKDNVYDAIKNYDKVDLIIDNSK